MEQKHQRIPMKEIQETPAHGCYVTEKNMRFCVLGTVCFALGFYLVGFFRGKRRH